MGYSENLRKLCDLKGLQQADLAARLGWSRSSLSRILRGVQEPKLSQAYELAQVLGVSLDALVEGRGTAEEARVATLDDDEWTILRVVRRLGTAEALDRLIGLDRPGFAESEGRERVAPKG